MNVNVFHKLQQHIKMTNKKSNRGHKTPKKTNTSHGIPAQTAEPHDNQQTVPPGTSHNTGDDIYPLSESGGKTRTEPNLKAAQSEENSASGQPLDTDDKTSEIDYNALDDISPNKELTEALDKQAESQKDAFDSLIRSNVKLEREIGKLEEKNSQLEAKHEVKCIELQAEKNRTTDLQLQVTQMEKDIKALVRASQKIGVTGKGKGNNKGKVMPSEKTETGNDTGDEEEKVTPKPEHTNHKKCEDKIQTLHGRIIQLVGDDQEKSHQLAKLEKEMQETKQYNKELEKHVPVDQREEIQHKLKNDEVGQRGYHGLDKEANAVYAGRPQTYGVYNRHDDNSIKDSTVCVIS